MMYNVCKKQPHAQTHAASRLCPQCFLCKRPSTSIVSTMNPKRLIDFVQCSDMMCPCGRLVAAINIEPVACLRVKLPKVLSKSTIETTMNPDRSVPRVPHRNMATPTRHRAIWDEGPCVRWQFPQILEESLIVLSSMNPQITGWVCHCNMCFACSRSCEQTNKGPRFQQVVVNP